MNWLKSFWKALTAPAVPTDRAVSEALVSFTPRARQVLTLASQEAEHFHHNFIGTEHLLLGLAGLGEGIAGTVLKGFGLDYDTARQEVENQIGVGPDENTTGKIPFTPRVKKVLSFATQEARAIHHTYVGPEHLLLGLLHEKDGVAARLLEKHGLDPKKIRAEILKELDPLGGD